MREEYDLSGAKRGAVIEERGKQRITIMLDSDILAAFRERAAASGSGYQTLINQALRDCLARGELEAAGVTRGRGPAPRGREGS